MYGHRRNMLDITYLSVVIILVMVYVIQGSGELLIRNLKKGESENEKISD